MLREKVLYVWVCLCSVAYTQGTQLKIYVHPVDDQTLLEKQSFVHLRLVPVALNPVLMPI